VFQDPRVVDEDIGLCYPGDYFTHVEPGPTDRSSASVHPLTLLSARIRELIRARLTGSGEPRGNGLGYLLSRSRWLRERAFHGLLDELVPREEGAAALDVGCGAGTLLKDLARAGWQPEGLEPDPVAAQVARRNSGCPVSTTDLGHAAFPMESFQLIVLSHVIEHLPEPAASLRRLASLLKPAGRIVLIYPNSEGLGARVFGSFWLGWDPPRHLSFPRPAALAGLAVSAGLSWVGYRTVSRRSRFEYAHSRPRSGSCSGTERRPGLADWSLSFMAALAVAVGLPLGDEIVAVLRKPMPLG
jgi:2-polyprenyl-3-methyl-5-hydroxy-6-metoxy-1,4-benzoquinol methylase